MMMEALIPEDERDDRCLRQGHEWRIVDQTHAWVHMICAFCGAEAQEEK